MMKPNVPELSYWESTQYFTGIDLLVIGSGIVGLNAAISAKEKHPQLRVVVLERGSLPSGASTRNAGFACFGSPSELLDDLEQQAESKVFDLVARRWEGLSRLRKRLGDGAIGYREWGGYELFRPGDLDIYHHCEEKLNFLNQKIEEITGKKEVYQKADHQLRDFGFEGVSKLLVNTAEGQIDTGQMMKALIAKARSLDIEVINGLGVQSFQAIAGVVELKLDNDWEIRAAKVLIATNGFARQLLPQLAVLPARNQVLITQVIPGLKIKGCFHYDRGYFYFRNINSRILFGGGRNLAPDIEQTDSFGTTSLIQEKLLQLLTEVICPGQNIQIDQWWSGILGIGKQKMPIIEAIAPGVVVAARMGGMGIAIGSLVGEEGAQLLLGA